MQFTIQPKYLKAALHCVSTDTTRYILNGVCVEPDKNGITLISTDGRLMLAIRPEISLWECPEKAEPFVIPSELLKRMPDASADGYVTVRLEGGRVFIDGETSASKAQIEGKFPTWRQVIPAQSTQPVEYFSFNITFAAKFSKVAHTLNKVPDIRIVPHAADGCSAFTVIPSNGDAQWVGWLMPVRSQVGSVKPAWLNL